MPCDFQRSGGGIVSARAPFQGECITPCSIAVRLRIFVPAWKWPDFSVQNTLGALVRALQTARSKVVHVEGSRMGASDTDRLLWEEHLHSGAHWSGVAR